MKKKSWFTIERVTILVLLALLFLLQQCHKSCPTEPREIIKTEIIRTSDTTVVTKVDTFTKYVKLDVPVPIPYPEDTTINLYTQEYSDSNLDATFINKVDGTLVESNFNYKLKIPKEILTTITHTDSVTRYVKTTKNIIAINGIFMGSQYANTFEAGVGISYYHKKGYIYQLNYLPLTKSVMVGFSYQLNKDHD
jgi:hypothetical protein